MREFPRPPPLAYESTGTVTQFTNGLEPHARSREVFTFHRPEELVRLASLEAQVRGRLPAGAKRILFLVDRNTLGDQAFDEFQRYTSPYNGYRFTDEYPVQHARRNAIEPAAKVVITTIR